MFYIKFSFLVFLILPWPLYSFLEKELWKNKNCFAETFFAQSQFEYLPFGVAFGNLQLTKNRCEVEVKYSTFATQKWIVDICRSPVHFKSYSFLGTEIYSKQKNCDQKKDDSFCREVKKLKDLLVYKGLYYAKGDKEDLSSDHGKTHCIYQLMDSYLMRNRVYDLTKSEGFFTLIDPDIQKKKTQKNLDSSIQSTSIPRGLEKTLHDERNNASSQEVKTQFY